MATSEHPYVIMAVLPHSLSPSRLSFAAPRVSELRVVLHKISPPPHRASRVCDLNNVLFLLFLLFFLLFLLYCPTT